LIVQGLNLFAKIVFIYNKVNIIDLIDEQATPTFVSTKATKPMLKDLCKLILICYHPERLA